MHIIASALIIASSIIGAHHPAPSASRLHHVYASMRDACPPDADVIIIIDHDDKEIVGACKQ